jgi:LCP family protein required for cell wall assembly
MAALLMWTAAGYFALRGAAGEAQDRVAPAALRALDDSGGGLLSTPATTLIVGIDALPGQNRSRADTIMLMRTDPDAGEIRYLSIPRDFRVIHPERGAEKINASFAAAGQAGVIRSVRRLTGLPVHHLMIINFARFPTLVDELGGVTVTNPTELRDCPYAGGRRVSFPQGEITLDGDRALEFARVRQCDDDFARARRQQEVVRAMQEKVLSTSGLPTAPWRGAAATRALGTDMGALDLATFGWLQSRLSTDAEDRILLSGTPERIDGASFVIGNPDANESEVARFLGR